MSPTLKPTAPIRDPQMDKMVRDLYARVGRLEPEVVRLGQKVVGVSQEVAKVGAERGLRWDVYSEGTPQPRIGDAVYYDPVAKAIYKADANIRKDVIGVKDATGQVIGNGLITNISGLAANKTYYLDNCDPLSMGANSVATDKECAIRYSSTIFAQAQGFKVTQVGYLTAIALHLRKEGSPTGNMFLEIRSDNGGVPSSTVLATSEYLPIANLPPSFVSDAENGVYFRLSKLLLVDVVTTYHIVIQTNVSGVSTTDYIIVRVVDAGSYADGQRSVSDDADVWTADATDDVRFGLWGLNPDLETDLNLTYSNPIGANSIYTAATEVTEIGKTDSSGTSMFVNIVRHPVQLFLQDYVTTVSYTGATGVFSFVPFSLFNTTARHFLQVTFRFMLSDATHLASSYAFINELIVGGAQGSPLSLLTGAPVQGILAQPPQGLINLRMRFELLISAGDTVTAGMVTVYGF